MARKLPYVFLLLAVVIGYQLWVKRGSAAGSLGYRSSWSEAIEAARTDGKPIILVFGGPW